MSRLSLVFAFSLWALLSLGCTKQNQVVVIEGGTMGTTYKVKYVPSISADPAKLQSDIEEILKKVNRQMSTYMKGSEISKVNEKRYDGDEVTLSSWFAQVLTYSLGLAQQTQGAFDPTLGPLVNLWGFGPDGKRKIPSKENIQKVKNYVGYKKLKLEPRAGKWFLSKAHKKVYIDLSATAKGFAVDKVSEYLSLKGIVNHLVDIGGELKVRGKRSTKKPWVVAIEKPAENQRSVQIYFGLNDKSIATSGTYRNFFKQNGRTYSHTINSKTSKPVRHNLLSVSVLHESCMEADGLATALMALGPKKAWAFAKKKNLAVYMIMSNGSQQKSKARFKTMITPEFRKIAQMSGR